MYTLNDYAQMMRDDVRMNAFIEAMRAAIHEGDIVLDLGAGTGIFSLLACQMGAKHVYALEMNPFIELGRALATANGFQDRITFFRGRSSAFQPPEKADLLIGDLRGKLPFLGHIVSIFADARERLLKPGGTIIPQRDRIYATLLHAPEWHRNQVLRPWVENPFDLDLRPGLEFQANIPLERSDRIKAEQMLLPGQLWATLDYATRTDPNASNVLKWTAERDGIAHFVLAWFETDLYEHIGFSNAPGAHGSRVYGEMLFPLKEPLELNAGDEVELTFGAFLNGNRYVWRWSVRHARGGASAQAATDQSTFFGMPLTDLRKRAGNYVPALSQDGVVTVFILDKMRQGLSLNHIAAEVQAAFPDVFPAVNSALARVAELSETFSV